MKIAVAVVALAALAACGGGGGGSAPSSGGSGSGSTATPTPAASASPTPSGAPSPGTLSASPSPLNLTAVGQTLTFAALDPNFSGTFAQTNTCAGVATVAPASAVGSGSVTFSVTSLAAGTCDVTVTANGQSYDEQIVVTTTSGVVQ